MVVALTDRQWRALLDVTGHACPDGKDPRGDGRRRRHRVGPLRNRDLIAAILRPWFEARDLAEVRAAFQGTGVSWGPVPDLPPARRRRPAHDQRDVGGRRAARSRHLPDARHATGLLGSAARHPYAARRCSASTPRRSSRVCWGSRTARSPDSSTRAPSRRITSRSSSGPGALWCTRRAPFTITACQWRPVFADPMGIPVCVAGRSECALLDELVSAIRRGESRSLVLRGEAGIGKTALLEYLIASASDLTVVRAVGVESEMELAFASLHQLCAPLLDRLERLPAPQRQALEIVFGLSAGAAPDRFSRRAGGVEPVLGGGRGAPAAVRRRRRAVAGSDLGADAGLRRPSPAGGAGRDRVRARASRARSFGTCPSWRCAACATATPARC